MLFSEWLMFEGGAALLGADEGEEKHKSSLPQPFIDMQS